MAAFLTVKAYLQKEDEGQPEIRRFPFQADLGQDKFRILQNKLTEVFPGLKTGRFSLHWKDDDGDLVKFSSQDELQQALNMVNDGVLRVYVMPEDTAEEAGEMAGVLSGDSDSEARPAKKRAKFEDRFSRPFCGPMWMHPAWHGHGKHFKKTKKLMKKEAKRMKKAEKKRAHFENRELLALKSQVPSGFRSWVRQYVKVWFSAGRYEAAKLEGIPEGAPPNFREWLVTYLEKFTEKQEAQTAEDTDKNAMEQDSGLPVCLQGLPDNYFRWLRLFVKRVSARFAQESSSSDTSDSDDAFGGSFWRQRGYGPWHRQMHRFRHSHHWMKEKHGWSSSESDDEVSKKRRFWKTISPEMRKYVRALMKDIHKGEKGKQAAVKEATPEGMRPEAAEFIQQMIAEWHAKLTSFSPRDVSFAMAQEERTGLPAGIEKEQIQWLCRFLARWHRRHAVKCDAMAAWSSEDSTTVDTSEDEQTSDGHNTSWHFGKLHGKGRKRHFGKAMMAGPPFFGHHVHGMHMAPFYGMQYGFRPCPPTPMMRAGMAPPFHHLPPFWEQMHPGMTAGCPLTFRRPFRGGRGCYEKKKQDMSQENAELKTPGSERSAGQEDMVSQVTEALKKM